MASLQKFECGVCMTEKSASFSCSHCKFVACNECNTKWFDSQLSTPSCMSCRSALNMSDLASSFSTSSIIKRFEDARRMLLVRADESHQLFTQLHIVPVLHNLQEAQRRAFELVKAFENSEATTRRAHLEFFETYVAALDGGRPDTSGKRAARSALKAEKKARSNAERAVGEACRDVQNLFESLTLAAENGGVSLAVQGVHERFVRCNAAECSAGLFSVISGKCMVCETMHCLKCFELDEKNHKCTAVAEADARFVLAHTKSCPRCHVLIQRAFGCNQMMCNQCNCIFDWSTGQEDKGVVHNPLFLALSMEVQAEVQADRAARGLAVPLLGRGAQMCDPNQELDPMCLEFDSPEFRNLLKVYKPLLPLTLEGKTYCYAHDGLPNCVSRSLLGAYQNVLHVQGEVLPQLRMKLATKFGERGARLLRLQRLVPGASISGILRVPLGHPDGDSKSFVLPKTQALSDAKFAAQLMRIDTERSKTEETIQLWETYVESQVDLFRAALVALPDERSLAVQRICEFRTRTEAYVRGVCVKRKIVPLQVAAAAARAEKMSKVV